MRVKKTLLEERVYRLELMENIYTRFIERLEGLEEYVARLDRDVVAGVTGLVSVLERKGILTSEEIVTLGKEMLAHVAIEQLNLRSQETE